MICKYVYLCILLAAFSLQASEGTKENILNSSTPECDNTKVTIPLNKSDSIKALGCAVGALVCHYGAQYAENNGRAILGLWGVIEEQWLIQELLKIIPTFNVYCHCGQRRTYTPQEMQKIETLILAIYETQKHPLNTQFKKEVLHSGTNNILMHMTLRSLSIALTAYSFYKIVSVAYRNYSEHEKLKEVNLTQDLK